MQHETREDVTKPTVRESDKFFGYFAP